MKKFVVSLLASMLGMAMTCSVFAASFVPSITYKPAPEITDEEHQDCIIITPVSEADKSTDISKEAADLLKKVYEDLLSGATNLSDIFPNADGLVVKDLFDLSGSCEELSNGQSVDLTLDVGVDANTTVYVMVYVDGKWVALDGVVNNGDGTITAAFNSYGPVAILVPGEAGEAPTTGDMNGTQIALWSTVACTSLLAMAAVTAVYRRKMSK